MERHIKLITFQKSKPSFVLVTFALIIVSPFVIYAQEKIPDQVMEIFENKCAFSGCHAGPSAGNDLDLTEEQAYASLVNQPSSDFPSLPLVKSGDPLRSYLIMKLVGTSGIKGAKMPEDKPISKNQLRVIAAWIKSLPKNLTNGTPKKKRYTQSFPGLSIATLQTPQTVRKGGFSYRIAHRWLGRVDNGISQFFGLDAGAHMLTEFSFAILNNFTLTLGRSGQNATYEFNGKWQLWRERTNGSKPVSAAIFAGVDWVTQTPGRNLKKFDRERFPSFAQLIVTKQISNRLAFLLSPGILVKGNPFISNEDAVFTLGLAGKFLISKGFSFFVETVPILLGVDTALQVGGAGTQNGQPIVYNGFTLGLERNLGGHVFHIYITNSLGLTPAQVMSGGNLDFAKGEFRLGFNIYRILGIP